MRSGPVLLAIGIVLFAAGLWVSTTPALFINEGNQCGVDGCRNVSATVPSSAPGALLVIVGLLAAAYGWTKRNGRED